MRRILLGSNLMVLLFAGFGIADGPKITDPKKADADFAFQGEYLGVTTDEVKVGAQVIALGKGSFRVLAYSEGLPGDPAAAGINDDTVVEGKLNEDKVVFTFDGGTASIQGGKMTVLEIGGNSLAVLKKVERKSETLGAKPPAGAIVLFDGKSTDPWKNGKISKDGLLMPGVTSKATFGDHTLHVEFRLPYQPQDRGQQRGNSGIYVQGRYEIQMLDSFGLSGEQNECGGIYSVKKPRVNMCYPPLSWQTYDIEYTAAKYDGDKLVTHPKMTVRHNGVVIHKDVTLPGNRSTTAAPTKPGNTPGPVYLQNHGCPVRYRNIWVVKK